MATNEDVIERLDRLAAIMQLAYREQIDASRAAIRADKVNEAILDGTKKWTAAGTLKTAVTKKTGKGGTTFADRVAELLESGALEKQGGGPTTQYRATGLV
jgi:hypothetical protein